IGLAAIPLPDVWCPLSDSLRMITGYGREVKVGDDVVARMVNFTRSTTATYIGKDGLLKTAAVNEPRFEREGLLIEGQSTNLLPTSSFPSSLNGWAPAGGGAGNVYTYGNPAPNGTNEALKASFALAGLDRTLPGVVQPGATYTFSFWAKNETATNVQLDIRINGGVSASAVTVPANTGWARYAVTQTAAAGDAILRMYTPTKNVEFYLWGMQLEALPFASSYIPTTGAAATRTADNCAIQLLGNFILPVTLCCNYDLLSASRSGFSPAQLIGFKANNKALDGLSVNTAAQPLRLQSLNESTGGRSPGAPCQLSGTAVLRAANGVRNEFSAGAFGAQTPGDWAGAVLGDNLYIGRAEAPENIRYLFGHIRNLRIWHRALTDEQIKAIA
ncbi:MAG: phage head spike fiber domain-containing protein, partial [Shewanella sp.]